MHLENWKKNYTMYDILKEKTKGEKRMERTRFRWIWLVMLVCGLLCFATKPKAAEMKTFEADTYDRAAEQVSEYYKTFVDQWLKDGTVETIPEFQVKIKESGATEDDFKTSSGELDNDKFTQRVRAYFYQYDGNYEHTAIFSAYQGQIFSHVNPVSLENGYYTFTCKYYLNYALNSAKFDNYQKFKKDAIAIVNSLDLDGKSDYEKGYQIAKWFNKNMHYALPQYYYSDEQLKKGECGLVLRSRDTDSELYENLKIRAGQCAHLSSIYCYMANYVGLDCRLVNLPKLNHQNCAIKLDGKYYLCEPSGFSMQNMLPSPQTQKHFRILYTSAFTDEDINDIKDSSLNYCLMKKSSEFATERYPNAYYGPDNVFSAYEEPLCTTLGKQHKLISVYHPSCTGLGYTEVECSECPYVEIGSMHYDAVAANPGHTYETKTFEGTCYMMGYTDDAICTKCGAYKNKGMMTYSMSYAPHTYEEIGSTAPTCTHTGYNYYTCSVCADIHTEVVPALGHNFETISATSSTFLKKGSKKVKCKRCGYKTSEEIPILEPSEENPEPISDATVVLPQTTYSFTGDAISPKPSVVCKRETGDEILTEGTDYTLSYEDNDKAGNAKVIIIGMGKYSGTTEASFVLRPDSGDVGEMNISLKETNFTYNGNTKTPEVAVPGLIKGTDYTVTYEDNKDASEYAKAIVKGIGSFTGEKVLTFTIQPMKLTEENLRVLSATYSGKTLKPTVQLKGTTNYGYFAPSNYDAVWSDNIYPGTGTVQITGKGNYAGTVTLHFTIGKLDLSKEIMIFEQSSYEYTGKEIKAKFKTELPDLVYTYKDNIDAGEATATVTSPYCDGSWSNMFTITKKKLSLDDFEMIPLVYNGEIQKPKVKTNLQDSDYVLNCGEYRDVGTYPVSIVGKENCTGTLSKGYTILPQDISNKTVTLSGTSFEYTGSTIEPTASIEGLNSDDYTVTYEDNISIGTATVKVEGKGNYTGTITTHFMITDKEDGTFVLTSETQPTCEEDGQQIFTNTKTREIQTVVLPKLGHAFGEYLTTKSATCKEEGIKTSTCERCGKTQTQIIPKLDHNWVIVSTSMVTCTEAGQTTSECTKCGEIKTETTPALGHQSGSLQGKEKATCMEDGYTGDIRCIRCGIVLEKGETIPATGKHKWGTWETTKFVTCETQGKESRWCDVCGEEENRIIPALGHQKIVRGRLSATANKDGYTGDTVCSRCGKVFAWGSVIPKTGGSTGGGNVTGGDQGDQYASLRTQIANYRPSISKLKKKGKKTTIKWKRAPFSGVKYEVYTSKSKKKKWKKLGTTTKMSLKKKTKKYVRIRIKVNVGGKWIASKWSKIKK